MALDWHQIPYRPIETLVCTANDSPKVVTWQRTAAAENQTATSWSQIRRLVDVVVMRAGVSNLKYRYSSIKPFPAHKKYKDYKIFTFPVERKHACKL